MLSIRLAVGLVACGLLVGACGSSSNADPAAPSSASGGTIAGKVSTADGRPLEGVQVSYDGWPDGALGTMQGNGRIASPASGHVDAKDGRYEIKVPPGQYTTEATATVKWHDKEYTFQLEPAEAGVDESARAAVTADKGLARDYVWKMTGTRPGKDPSYLGSGWDTAVYGASIGIALDAWDTENYRPSQPIFEEADKPSAIELTLAPKGKLIDGSEGKTITQTVQIAENGHYGFGLRGIPVGDYACVAKLVKPDGTTSPLRVSLTKAEYVTPHVDSKTKVAWKDSVDVVFPPAEGVLRYLGADRVIVYIGK